MAVSLLTAWPAAAAYLPLLGPGPLRFERPVRLAKATALPPVGNPSATEAEATTAPTPPPPPPVPPPVHVEPPPAAITNPPPPTLEIEPPTEATGTNQTAQAAPPAAQGSDASGDPEITPQMLVQYFKMPVPAAGTNSAGVVVTMPLFQPPQPGRIPPSSARYETPEPRRSMP